nr:MULTISPECIES: protein-glutamate O-methyltransferase CheR [Pseudomonas]
MTVNETYFFREEYQLKCLVTNMLEEVTRRKRDSGPIRIWSMPSSSGEEPYSIAMYLLEYWKGIEEWDVELIASDIDTNILERARRGLYSPRSVHNLPATLLEKYFKQQKSGDYQLIDDIRQSVEFSRVNLMSAADVKAYKGFDIIFCRNLLIYFDDLSRRQAADTFFDALNPGGMICLGHSESMSRISSLFQVRKFPEAIVYQKPLEAR